LQVTKGGFNTQSSWFVTRN